MANPNFFGLEVVLAERFEPGSSTVRVAHNAGVRFFTDLGFVVPDNLARLGDEVGEVSLPDELMSAMDTDMLVWNIGNSPQVRTEIEELPQFPDLHVVQGGRVLWPEDDVVSAALAWATILSLPYTLDRLLSPIQGIAALPTSGEHHNAVS